MKRLIVVASALTLLVTTVAIAQFGGPRRFGRRGGELIGSDGRPHRRGIPDWKLDEKFKDDVFTFCRIQYSSYNQHYKWATDYPDADLNFSFRLQQLTSLPIQQLASLSPHQGASLDLLPIHQVA